MTNKYFCQVEMRKRRRMLMTGGKQENILHFEKIFYCDAFNNTVQAIY